MAQVFGTYSRGERERHDRTGTFGPHHGGTPESDHRPGLLAGRHVRVAVPLHDPGRRSPVRLRILKFLPARTCLQLAATLYIPRGMGG